MHIFESYICTHAYTYTHIRAYSRIHAYINVYTKDMSLNFEDLLTQENLLTTSMNIARNTLANVCPLSVNLVPKLNRHTLCMFVCVCNL